MAGEEELPDFDEEKAGGGEPASNGGAGGGGGVGQAKEEASAGGGGRGGENAIRATGFREFLLKAELMQGIVECGFEHPSEVQHACIPQAVLGNDILCQAKSGMGKTAVFVLACLQLVDLKEKVLRVLVLCHTRELAYQIEHEFKRLGKYITGLKVAAVYGGVKIENDKEMLRTDCPHILVGTPGKLVSLVRGPAEAAPLRLGGLTHFVLDECDRCIDQLDLRRDVQQIFIRTPKKKQVMMFSATISPETRTVCKKFMQGPHEITVESEAKLTLHGLLQYYRRLEEKKKNKTLIDMLDALEFNQVVIFVRTVKRALALDGLLRDCNFPSMTLHTLPAGFEHKVNAGETPNAEHGRIDRLKMFKEFYKRILVTTDLFGRGMDVERVNIVINYDMPQDSDMYLHRVGRAGRFGTKGLAVTFVASDEDSQVLDKVQNRFEVNIEEMPAHIDTTSYLNA